MMRTLTGSAGFSSIRLLVFADSRPILCLAFTIVQVVLRFMPSAFACLSKDV